MKKLVSFLLLVFISTLVVAQSDIKELRKQANQGDAVAQYQLGKMYLNGIDIAQDSKKALEWFTKSANQNEPNAQFELGNLNFQGVVTQKNVSKAMDLFLKSANQDVDSAQAMLGSIYFYGKEGISLDFKKAFHWLFKSATSGNAVSQRYIGSMYRKGNGVEADKEQARIWYKKSAQQGDVEAQVAMAKTYAKTDRERLYWYKKAANQGSANAQFILGASYYYGYYTLKKNKKLAKYWVDKAIQKDKRYLEKYTEIFNFE